MVQTFDTMYINYIHFYLTYTAATDVELRYYDTGLGLDSLVTHLILSM